MKATNWMLRVALGWIALVVAQMVVGMLIRVEVPNASGILPWLLLTNLLTAAAMAYVASRADWRGWKLGAALALVPGAIGLADALEGAVFLGNAGLPWTRIALQTLFTYVLVAPMWGWIFGRGAGAVHEEHEGTAIGRVWRFAVSDVAYLVLYFTAGLIIFPYVRDFYATQTVPGPGRIVGLQLLVRGPVFIGLCLLLRRLLGLSRGWGAVAVGLVFTLLSGVVPLLIPNPVFPDTVRFVHMAEVTSSNFLFGMIVAWLWGPRHEQRVLVTKAA
jgi:hypothetical protein